MTNQPPPNTPAQGPVAITLQCVTCNNAYPANELRYLCDCGGLLDVWHNLE